MKPVRVGLMDLGLDPDMVESLATRLNRISAVRDAFRFEVLDPMDIENVLSDHVPRKHFFDAHEIIDHVGRTAVGPRSPHLILALTAVPLAVRESGAETAEWDYDYFGVWRPRPGGQSIDGPPTIGVVSTNVWARRYERSAYRTTGQYLEHLVVAFLGDTLYRAPLTHARFRHCVFDYNEDLDSIVESVRSAKLCRHCITLLNDDRHLGPRAAIVGGRKLSAAFGAILRDVRRPPASAVFQVMQNDGTFSILILGVLAAIGINVFSTWLTESPFKVAAIVVTFGLLLGWSVWQYLRPGPPLR